MVCGGLMKGWAGWLPEPLLPIRSRKGNRIIGFPRSPSYSSRLKEPNYPASPIPSFYGVQFGQHKCCRSPNPSFYYRGYRQHKNPQASPNPFFYSSR